MLKQCIPDAFCLACRGCCRFRQPGSCWAPRLTRKEQEELRIASPEVPLVYDLERQEYLCGFLQPADNTCRIYDRRPFECRLYPFLLNRSEGRVFLAVDYNCPFADEHRQHAAIREHAAYLMSWFRSPEGERFVRDNLRLAQGYVGVDNLYEICPVPIDSHP